MASGNPNRSPGRLTPSQARATRRARRNKRKRLLRYGSATAIAAVSLIFIVGLFLPGVSLSGGHSSGGGGLFGGGAPDGPGTRMDEVGREHISPGQEHDPYNSVTATSGAHFGSPLAPVRWGVHDTALEPEEYLHNLEHGGVAIFYDCPDGCETIEGQLSDLVSEAVNNGGKVLLAPHSDTGATITAIAWTFMHQFDFFDEDNIRAFVNAHESSPNAPEPSAR